MSDKAAKRTILMPLYFQELNANKKGLTNDLKTSHLRNFRTEWTRD